MFDEKNQNMSMDSTYAEHKTLIDPMWLVNQLKREDHAERMAAFYESIENAIVTDLEDWDTKGTDAFYALMSNDATALLIALCGWGPIRLAQRALLMSGRCQYSPYELDAKLFTEWDDGTYFSSACRICSERHRVFDFDPTVFTHPDCPSARITRVFVRFDPLQTGYEYDVLCVSEEERDNAHDSDIFWYTPVSGTQGAGHPEITTD